MRWLLLSAAAWDRLWTGGEAFLTQTRIGFSTAVVRRASAAVTTCPIAAVKNTAAVYSKTFAQQALRWRRSRHVEHDTHDICKSGINISAVTRHSSRILSLSSCGFV